MKNFGDVEMDKTIAEKILAKASGKKRFLQETLSIILAAHIL